MPGAKFCTSSCVKYKWENTHHNWFVAMRDNTPQIASVPVGPPVVCCSVLFLPSDSRFVELLQRQSRNCSCPHTQVSISHQCSPLSTLIPDCFRRPEGVEMHFLIDLPSGLFTPVISQRPRAHLIRWYLGVLLLWCRLRHLWMAAGQTWIDNPSAGPSPHDWPETVGLGEERTEIKCHLMSSS